jgi:hypothetical protein
MLALVQLGLGPTVDRQSLHPEYECAHHLFLRSKALARRGCLPLSIATGNTVTAREGSGELLGSS